MKKVTKPADESVTKNEQSFTHTPSQAELNEEKQLEAQPKRYVPHSVQLKLPTTILNLGGTLNQVGKTQAVIIESPNGIILRSYDNRCKLRTRIPWGAIKAYTDEEVDAPEPVQPEGKPEQG